MQFFDKFDPEDQEGSEDIKLNLPEKGTVLAFVTLMKVAANKAKRAKTYGDLYKIINKFESTMKTHEKQLDEKYGEDRSMEDLSETEKEEAATLLTKQVEEAADEIENLI